MSMSHRAVCMLCSLRMNLPANFNEYWMPQLLLCDVRALFYGIMLIVMLTHTFAVGRSEEWKER